MDKCGFCLNALRKSEGINVKELVIDTHPRIVKFTDVLYELFYCEIDVSKICSECWDAVNKQYTFRETLKKVIKMPLPKHIETIKKVQNFLSRNQNCSIVNHCGIFSVVPESRKSVMSAIKSLQPEVKLERVSPDDIDSISKQIQSKPNTSIAGTSKKMNLPDHIKSTPNLNQFSGSSYSILPDFDDDIAELVLLESDNDNYVEYPTPKKRKNQSSSRKRKTGKNVLNGSQLVEATTSTQRAFTHSVIMLPDYDEDTVVSCKSDDDYGKPKRKKKSSPKRRSPKKQKLSNTPQFVKKEQSFGIIENNEQQQPPEDNIESAADPLSIGVNNVLNTTGLIRNSNEEQKVWLSNMLAKTKRNGNEYECIFCSKSIKTFNGISYHYTHLHYLKKNMTVAKMWVSQKVREGSKILTGEDGARLKVFQCTECILNFNSQPGLRYHLTKHLKSDANDDDFCAFSEDET